MAVHSVHPGALSISLGGISGWGVWNDKRGKLCHSRDVIDACTRTHTNADLNINIACGSCHCCGWSMAVLLWWLFGIYSHHHTVYYACCDDSDFCNR